MDCLVQEETDDRISESELKVKTEPYITGGGEIKEMYEIPKLPEEEDVKPCTLNHANVLVKNEFIKEEKTKLIKSHQEDIKPNILPSKIEIDMIKKEEIKSEICQSKNNSFKERNLETIQDEESSIKREKLEDKDSKFETEKREAEQES